MYNTGRVVVSVEAKRTERWNAAILDRLFREHFLDKVLEEEEIQPCEQMSSGTAGAQALQ